MLSNTINTVWAQTIKIISCISKYLGTFTSVSPLSKRLNEAKIGQF